MINSRNFMKQSRTRFVFQNNNNNNNTNHNHNKCILIPINNPISMDDSNILSQRESNFAR